jgi:myosin I
MYTLYADILSLQKAMQIIGLSAEEQTQIFRMLAGILWIGNVQFNEKDDGNAQVFAKGFLY